MFTPQSCAVNRQILSLREAAARVTGRMCVREHKCMSVLSSLGWGVILQLSQSSVLYSPTKWPEVFMFLKSKNWLYCLGYGMWVFLDFSDSDGVTYFYIH